MTKADAARLVALIVTAYPNFDKFKDEAAITATVNLWAVMFADDDSRVVSLAVKKHISTSKWPPSVAELRELMVEIQRPELIPPDEAWAAVSDVLSVHGAHCHAELDRLLPPLVARAVEVVGYSNLYELNRVPYGDSKPGMARLSFMQQYGAMYEREKARAMTPHEITEKIDAISRALPDKGQGMIEAREQDRIEHDEMYRSLSAGYTPSPRIRQTTRKMLEG